MAAAQPNPPMSRIEAEVRRGRALLEKRQFAQTLELAQSLLTEVPENRDALYLLAVSQRYLGRIADALTTLVRFERLHPGYGRLFQERGHCYRALGEPQAAIEAYLRAVNLNHTLVASWKALQELYGSLGQGTQAEMAAAHVSTLAGLPPAIVGATNLLAEGEIYAAEHMVRQFLLGHPDDVEGMRLLAKIGVKLEVLDDADFLLESVLLLAPDYHLARYEYVSVLLQRHKHQQALAEVKKLLSVDPASRPYQTLYADVCVGLGNHEEALRVYRELVAAAPQARDLHLSIAHTLKTLGRQRQAIESYRTAAAVSPSYGDAYWSLANLKTYRFSDEEIAAMRGAEADPASSFEDRFHLCFALGKALEDRKEYAESFRYYERGNALKKSHGSYRADLMERNMGLQRAVCTRELFEARAGGGCQRADPIFIVGLPRAGSTLLEQILASHSQIEGTMELADIPRLAHQLNGRMPDERNPAYPRVLASLSPEQLRSFGERYIADTQIYRGGKPFFIDKMPNNFRHVGLIQLILPRARIIDARREAMACCFSNFKQLYAHGQDFTYGLTDIAGYYRGYVELMAHWDAVLPGKVLRVQHEELVEDLEPQVRRILAFLGLEFEPACLEFYKTERSVRTASSEQVRQPIYKEGVDQWRNFEPWLGPLKAALGDLVPA
ncbi:MAG TPA: sulfotransferase [Steroidobacteraceae bacterium]|nr:sulfotransferase [Steroidobacteraceae bacterium]